MRIYRFGSAPDKYTMVVEHNNPYTALEGILQPFHTYVICLDVVKEYGDMDNWENSLTKDYIVCCWTIKAIGMKIMLDYQIGFQSKENGRTISSYRQMSIDTPFPSLKSVMNQRVFICPPTTTVLIALGLVKGSINVSGGIFSHVA